VRDSVGPSGNLLATRYSNRGMKVGNEEPRIRLFVAGERIDARLAFRPRNLRHRHPSSRGERGRRGLIAGFPCDWFLGVVCQARREIIRARSCSASDKPKRRPPLPVPSGNDAFCIRENAGITPRRWCLSRCFSFERESGDEREYRGSGICNRSRFGENNYTGGGCIFHGIVSRERRVRSPRD